jgi:RHS repeat-associated protein
VTAGKKITYSYDGIDRRNQLIEPGGGRFTYLYDAADRMIVLINPQGLRTSFGYDVVDRVTSKRLANTDRTSYAYDDAHQTIRIANVIPGVLTLSSYSYSYDALGNRQRVLEATGDIVTWTYDNSSQLTRERRSGLHAYNVSYNYDPIGNRTRKIDGGTITTLSYDSANQMVKQLFADGTRTTCTFDSNGNLVRTALGSTVTTYSWDIENQLTKVRPSNLSLGITTLVYDGEKNRVRDDDSTGTRKYIWDREILLEETDQNDVTQVVYSVEPDVFGRLISQIRTSATNFFMFDATGSTSGLVDNTGQTVTDSYIYKSFGEMQYASGGTTNPFKFKGQIGYYSHANIAQLSLRMRTYDPATGRFVSADPIGVSAGRLEPYTYARNNPGLNSDPSGLFPIPRPLPQPPTYDVQDLAKECRRLKKHQESMKLGAPEFGLVGLVLAVPQAGFCCEVLYNRLVLSGGPSPCERAIQTLLRGFPKRCPIPRVKCEVCFWAGQLLPTGELSICVNVMMRHDFNYFCSTVYHELIHAYQRCHPGYWSSGNDCVQSLRQELQAYICEGWVKACRPGGNFFDCFLAVLGSSCGGCRCTPEEVKKFYKDIYSWYLTLWRILGFTICRWPSGWVGNIPK